MAALYFILASSTTLLVPTSATCSSKSSDTSGRSSKGLMWIPGRYELTTNPRAPDFLEFLQAVSKTTNNDDDIERFRMPNITLEFKQAGQDKYTFNVFNTKKVFSEVFEIGKELTDYDGCNTVYYSGGLKQGFLYQEKLCMTSTSTAFFLFNKGGLSVIYKCNGISAQREYKRVCTDGFQYTEPCWSSS